MDSSTHHDMFASLIAANKLTVSTTRDVAVFLFFIFFRALRLTLLDVSFGPPARSSDHLKHCTQQAVRSGSASLQNVLLGVSCEPSGICWKGTTATWVLYHFQTAVIDELPHPALSVRLYRNLRWNGGIEWNHSARPIRQTPLRGQFRK